MARTTEEVLGTYVITGCGIVNEANFMFSLDPDDEVEPWKSTWFDGTKWHRIWGEIGGMDIVRMELTKQQLEAAEKGYNAINELIGRDP